MKTETIELPTDQAQIFCNLGWYASECHHTAKAVEDSFHDMVDCGAAIRLAKLRLLRMRANQAAIVFDCLSQAVDKILEVAGEE